MKTSKKNKPINPDAPLKVTHNASLPALIKDWIEKEYPGKCCYSMREYNDVELNLVTHEQVNTVSSLIISPNSKLFSNPDCAYLISVTTDSVEALHYYTLPMPLGAAVLERSQYTTVELDWRDPSFFEQLAKELGCRCQELKNFR